MQRAHKVGLHECRTSKSAKRNLTRKHAKMKLEQRAKLGQDSQIDETCDNSAEQPVALASHVKAEATDGEEARGDIQHNFCGQGGDTEDKAPPNLINGAAKASRLRIDGKVKCYYCNKRKNKT